MFLQQCCLYLGSGISNQCFSCTSGLTHRYNRYRLLATWWFIIPEFVLINEWSSQCDSWHMTVRCSWCWWLQWLAYQRKPILLYFFKTRYNNLFLCSCMVRNPVVELKASSMKQVKPTVHSQRWSFCRLQMFELVASERIATVIKVYDSVGALHSRSPSHNKWHTCIFSNT